LFPNHEQVRVLIVRLGAMGDILHAMPGVAALRQTRPAWHIGWAVEPRWQPLICADTVHLVNAKTWARAPFARQTVREIRALRRELRARHYDICIDLQGAVRSAIIGRMAGAQRMIGEAHPREWAARYFFREAIQTRGVHVIEQAAEVCAAAIGEPLLPVSPQLPADPEAEAWADDIVRAMGGRPVVLLNPGAGWGAKRWPAERYGLVARALAEQGFSVWVNAGPEERLIAEEVVRRSGEQAHAPQGEHDRMSIARLVALTRRISLAIAGDTGPLHLACALGKPVVGIFGPTDPARNGPFGVPFRVLRHPQSKRDHTRHQEPEAGLLTITVDQVLEAAAELLRGSR
jgi:heptosyltransferase I